ncbi:MAG: hypothetical protein O9301_08205 [Leptospira sp.]|nr:hypothetical protein [Leptospira sp.]
MKKQRFLSVLFSFYFIFTFQLLYGNEQTLQFSLSSESKDEKIIQYEIELWKEKSMEAEFPLKLLAKPGKVILKVPNGYQYFRISGIAERNIRGYWSSLYSISEFGKPKPVSKQSILETKPPKNVLPENTGVLVPISDQNGNLKPYLTTKKITIKDQNQLYNTVYTYRLNGSSWIESKTLDVEFLSDGFQVLEYGSVNILGNREERKRLEFFTDYTPPTTRYMIEPGGILIKKDFFTHPDAKINLIAEDSGSGVKTIYYQTECDGKNLSIREELPESGLTFNNLKQICDSSLKFIFYSVDQVGNEEKPKHVKIEFLRASR